MPANVRNGAWNVLHGFAEKPICFRYQPLFIDDLELSWVDLGRLLASYEGWHLRIEIKDVTEALG